MTTTLKESGRKDIAYIQLHENEFKDPIEMFDKLYYNGSWYTSLMIQIEVEGMKKNIGYMSFHLVKTEEDPEVLEYKLLRVFIDEKFRNQGVATKHLKEAAEFLKYLNYSFISAPNEDTPLKNILLKLGFKEQGDKLIVLRNDI